MSEGEYVLKSDYDKLVKDLKKLQRQVKKLIKITKTEESEDKPKKLNGFAKPTLISDQLATFLGLEKDSEISRTEVTKKLNVYIKEHKLQNEENKKIIKLDDKLKEIISVPDDVQLTFFNLQKYIKHHYQLQPKTNKLTVDTSDSSEKVNETVENETVENETVENETKSPKKKVVRKKVVKK